MVFLILFMIPAMVLAAGAAIVMFFFSNTDRKIDWQEFLLMLGAQAIIAGISCAIVSCQNTADVQILNGEITGKEQNRVSCSHSYQCNCRQESYSCGDSKNPRTCYNTVCDTCYEHSHDYDWDVYSNIGTFTIDRVDRQGVNMPERWHIAKIGEPASRTASYDNYIKASPDTLFRNQGVLEKFKNMVPNEPMRIYDYYRLDRFVQIGTKLPDVEKYNNGLSEINKKLGPAHQANVILVTTNKPREYFYAVRQAWVGGKKNDVVAMVGLDGNRPVWVEIMAWDLDKRFDVSLRNQIMNLKEITPDNIIPLLNSQVAKYYKRKPMADFEYLASIIKPTDGQWWAAIILGIFVAIGQIFIYSQPGVDGPWMPQTNKNRYYNRYNRY